MIVGIINRRAGIEPHMSPSQAQVKSNVFGSACCATCCPSTDNVPVPPRPNAPIANALEPEGRVVNIWAGGRDPVDVEAEIAKLKSDGRLGENDQLYLYYWGGPFEGGGHPSTRAGAIVSSGGSM